MKNSIRFVCLTIAVLIACCYFISCSDDKADSIGSINPTTTNDTQPDVDINTNTNIETDAATTDETKNDPAYKYCVMYWPDGRTIYCELISWTKVSENLIQVTVTNTRLDGFSGRYWNGGETMTVTLIPDRVVFMSDKT